MTSEYRDRIQTDPSIYVQSYEQMPDGTDPWLARVCVADRFVGALSECQSVEEIANTAQTFARGWHRIDTIAREAAAGTTAADAHTATDDDTDEL